MTGKGVEGVLLVEFSTVTDSACSHVGATSARPHKHVKPCYSGSHSESRPWLGYRISYLLATLESCSISKSHPMHTERRLGRPLPSRDRN
jgi:hypothetical protein